MQPRTFTDYGIKLSQAGSSIFAPSRNIIIEMIMVQFIAIIIALASILVFKGDTMASNDITVLYLSLVFLALWFS